MGLDLYRSGLAQGRDQYVRSNENYFSVTADKFLTSCENLCCLSKSVHRGVR